MGGNNIWFETLTGFKEESPEHVRSNLEVSGSSMTSAVNGRSWSCGSLETPTLAEFRSRVTENRISSGQIEIREVIGDAKALHADAGNSGALFQVASQFNLLEMSHPGLTPEDGVAIYGKDVSALLVSIAQQRVGKRPGRVEPRALKRRPKPYPLLNQPRQLARQQILEYGHPKKLK